MNLLTLFRLCFSLCLINYFYCDERNPRERNINRLHQEYNERKPPDFKLSLQYCKDDYIMNIIRDNDSVNNSHRPRLTNIFFDYPHAESMKVFGIGLSRTGSHSILDFFRGFGLQTVHSDFRLTQYLPNSRHYSNFSGLYDDIDVIVGLSTAPYYTEIMKIYPQAKFILTYRDPDDWFRSMFNYVNLITKELFGSIGLPLHLRLQYESIYGSQLPDRDIWIRSYLSHYNSVRNNIPPNQLLQLRTDSLSTRKSGKKLCAFLNVPLNYCTFDVPQSNSLDESRRTILQKVQSGKLINLNPNLLSDPNKANSKYAYVSMISDPSKNSYKWNFAMASIVMCQSIRNTYVDGDPLKTFDMVLMIIGSASNKLKARLLQCYDRLINIPILGNGPRSIPDNLYSAVIRSKFWAWGLTEYHRIQFIDADLMVVRNLDHYFFRSYYEPSGKYLTSVHKKSILSYLKFWSKTFKSHAKDLSNTLSWKPKKFYSAATIVAPVNAGVMSFEPSKQTVVDIKAIFDFGNWDFDFGWMGYGHFNFSAERLTESFIDPTISWKNGGKDEDYPFLPLYSPASLNMLTWHDSTWLHYCSWSDQGMALYYFYLLNQIGGVVSHDDYAHELVHFVGIHKPWLTMDKSSMWLPSGEAMWEIPTRQWHKLARALHIKVAKEYEEHELRNITELVQNYRNAVGSLYVEASRIRQEKNAKQNGVMGSQENYKSSPQKWTADGDWEKQQSRQVRTQGQHPPPIMNQGQIQQPIRTLVYRQHPPQPIAWIQPAVPGLRDVA